LRFDGAAAPRRDLERLLAAMTHRGPDRRAAWSGGPAALGHLLMRVTEEDSFDAQPLADSAGVTLTADVRLDNREGIAAALAISPPALAKIPDSALLLAAYKQWGETCVDHLLGDFVFAIWDARAGKLVLARDHMGQRRVFIHRGQGFFAFASDVKALWAHADVPRALDETNFARQLLLDFRPGNAETVFAGIGGLAGGTVMTVGIDGRLTARRYWAPRADPAHMGRDEAYYVEAYRRVLGEAVACRLRRATKPCGLLLGGGFDSTAIAGLAGPVVAAQGRKLICAASVMPENYSGPIRHARAWVELCRRKLPYLDVHYVTRAGADVLDGLDNAFVRFGTPPNVNRYVGDELLSAIAAAGARVVMDGHGGDYTLNPRASYMIAEFLRRGQLRRYWRELRAYSRQPDQSPVRAFKKTMRDFFPRLARFWSRLRHGPETDYAAAVLAPEFLGQAKTAGVLSAHELQRALGTEAFSIKASLERQSATAGMGTAMPAPYYGLEFTRPFHDKRVVELALAIPDTLYFKEGRERHLARLALADIYPAEFQARDTYNDDITPDFLAMVRRIEPQLLAEIERMERSPALARIFNFAKVRKLLTQRPLEAQRGGHEYETVRAISTILRARYVEWFRRDNA
jgi:asparagine synthase (glutamine-hydrolysing)